MRWRIDGQGLGLNYNRTIGEPPEGHPIDALLAGYAAKTLPPPLAALTAAHLELKPDNRGYLAALEAVHGVLLEELKPVPLAGRDRRLVNIFSAPEPNPDQSPSRPAGEGEAVLPRALRRIAGCDYADLPWRNCGTGLQDVLLAGASATARFVRVRPGTRLPVACEAGSITAVVLAGAANGGSAHFARGDIIFTGPDMPHAPTAADDQDCVCFVVAEGPAKPVGPLSRMLNRVTGG